MLKITIFSYEKITQKYQVGIRLLKVLIKYPLPASYLYENTFIVLVGIIQSSFETV